MLFNMYFTLVIASAFFSNMAHSYRVDKYPLVMPDVVPQMVDAYICTPIRIDSSKSYYVVGFEPNATSHTVHHILIYGCKSPGARTKFWNCGEMVSTVNGQKYANPCSEGAQIIYAWAMDAPKLELPEDVGFKIGGDSQIQYLVLQVHYSSIDPFKNGAKDRSGVYLQYTERPMPKQAGVFLLGTGGMIPPTSTTHMETACVLKETKTIHPFAFRTHTHKLGTVVSGYRVRNVADESQWTLLGHRDPQTPQMFYPTASNEPIHKGDILAARCTMVSNRTTLTEVGSTNKDEMCNFYLMYYVDGGEPLKTKYCFSAGPPYYYWRNSKFINNYPDQAASSLDEQNERENVIM